MESSLPPALEEPSLPPGFTAKDNESTRGNPAPYIVEPTAPHTHTTILLHGLGSNGRAFGSFFLTASVMSNDSASPYSRPLNVLYPSMRWVFPTASWRRSRRFKGVKLTSWLDISSVQDPSINEETQIEGLCQSSQYLRDLICEEVQKLKDAWGGGDGAEKRITFGGLSQGCAISLATLLSLDYSLGGWVGMSGYLPFKRMFKEELNTGSPLGGDGILFQEDDAGREQSPADEVEDARGCPAAKALNVFRQEILSIPPHDSNNPPDVLETPAFYGHGSDDEKIACRLGDELVETLTELGMTVRHQIYPGLGHWFQAPEEINDMISVFTKNGAWPDHVN